MSFVTRSFLEGVRQYLHVHGDTRVQPTHQVQLVARPPIPSHRNFFRVAQGIPRAPGLLRLG